MPNEVSRRTFLRIAAAAGAVAAVPGCQPAARQLIPYVIPDENVIPGVPSYFATRCTECSAGCGVIARVIEGRSNKLEGNPSDPISAGSTCARGQSALQVVYNPDRLANPARATAAGPQPITWDSALEALNKGLRAAAAKGAGRVAFIGAPQGPTLEKITRLWLGAWNSQRYLAYEPLDHEQERAAVRQCFGRDDLPHYQIHNAEVLISFGADFLESWRSPVEFARQWAQFRAPRTPSTGGGITVGRSIYIGPRLSMTAAKCDQFIAARPGTEAAVALAILNALTLSAGSKGAATQPQFSGALAAYDAAAVEKISGVPAAAIRKIAGWVAASGASLALPGGDDPALHQAVCALNSIAGNIGKTVRFYEGERETPPTTGAEMAALIQSMNAGEIDVLMIAGGNPRFSISPAMNFDSALRKIPMLVWCGGVPDESAEPANLMLPIHHTLEQWSDGAPRPGVNTLGQPVMQPVFNSRPLGDILLSSARANPAVHPLWEDTHAAVMNTWRDLHAAQKSAEPFEQFWDRARQQGGIFTTPIEATVSLAAQALANLPATAAAPAAQLTMVAYPHPLLYDGRGANQPWLQEIPEPLTKLVWDSWAEVHPDTARKLKLAQNDVVELRSPRGAIEVAVLVLAQAQRDVIAVPIGQGHTSYGRYARGRGANPWRLLEAGKRTAVVQVKATGRRGQLVSTQFTSDMMDRELVEAISLDQVRNNTAPPPEQEPVPEPYEQYEKRVYQKHQWGMTIDLNSCTGCSACIAACYAENNIPWVGKTGIKNGRDMSWLRLERYFPTPTNKPGPQVLTMPMLCQHCDHAPCEPVCPVFASYHTDEGLNGQIYNRCVGTRYCENNCPYKVRRFNWKKPEWVAPFNLQLNPDVTVRGAGVMEKCTFCVQRIRFAEMEASAHNRQPGDGEIVPACAQACPAKAISFGDQKDPESAMMRRRSANAVRNYSALEDLNTLPSIIYLRDVYREPGDKA